MTGHRREGSDAGRFRSESVRHRILDTWRLTPLEKMFWFHDVDGALIRPLAGLFEHLWLESLAVMKTSAKDRSGAQLNLDINVAGLILDYHHQGFCVRRHSQFHPFNFLTGIFQLRCDKLPSGFWRKRPSIFGVDNNRRLPFAWGLARESNGACCFASRQNRCVSSNVCGDIGHRQSILLPAHDLAANETLSRVSYDTVAWQSRIVGVSCDASLPVGSGPG